MGLIRLGLGKTWKFCRQFSGHLSFYISHFCGKWSIPNCYKQPPIRVEMHIHRECTDSPSPSTAVSLVMVWSGSHRATVFMSGPGTFQPSSCTWCLWKVYTSHRTCPADSPSALLNTTINSHSSIQQENTIRDANITAQSQFVSLGYDRYIRVSGQDMWETIGTSDGHLILKVFPNTVNSLITP